ncbi:P-loop containing NTP hydrolase pore-1-domain-containing protein [Baffinella frigidus]|nr:P-loop containing NTP hydrolase pore-1-domain-containing protein [Cryptophyta sp. CCMP2293]
MGNVKLDKNGEKVLDAEGNEQRTGQCSKTFLVVDELQRTMPLARAVYISAGRTSLVVDELQRTLPLARVVYVSATGASQPEHFQAMGRLGLWGEGTAFMDATEFVRETKKGVGAMELVAMHSKSSGQYLARSLSFEDASFAVEMYDKSVDLFCQIIKAVSNQEEQDEEAAVDKILVSNQKERDQDAAEGRLVDDMEDDEMEDSKPAVKRKQSKKPAKKAAKKPRRAGGYAGSDYSDYSDDEEEEVAAPKRKRNTMSLVWGAHQRFFANLLFAAKVSAFTPQPNMFIG